MIEDSNKNPEGYEPPEGIESDDGPTKSGRIVWPSPSPPPEDRDRKTAIKLLKIAIDILQEEESTKPPYPQPLHEKKD